MNYKIDLHCHTVASGHAYSTLQENIRAAADKGMKIVGVSDHAPTMPDGAHPHYFYNLKVIPKEIDGVRVLKGIEANIIDYEGSLDVSGELLENLDYVIASMHPPCLKFGSVEENTNAVVGAMKNPYVKIIGHPDDSRYPIDYEKVVKAAKQYDVLLEVNNSSLSPESFREGAWENVKKMLSICKEYQVKMIFGSDAHISFSVGEFSNCIKLVQELNFPEELIMNNNVERLEKFLSER